MGARTMGGKAPGLERARGARQKAAVTDRKPPPPPARVAFWRRTPPAVFPIVMGLFGLALAWRRAAEALGIPMAISDLILGAVTLLFTFTAAAYLAKLARRPAALIEDLRVLPGRTGVAAFSLSGKLLAAGLVPFAPEAATVLLYVFLAVHVCLAVLVLYLIFSAPPGGRMVTPGMHLTFVGFIVAPLAAIPLGLTGLAQFCFAVAMASAAAIYGISAAQMARRDTPPPLRPLMAIHLAPMALFGTVSLGLGLDEAALPFAALAIGVLAALLIRGRYIAAAGFSPLWGAFTFPLAAFAALMLMMGGASPVFPVFGSLALAAATVAIPVIAGRVLTLWAKGVLAVKTNAAVA